jgi:hypothetical protein
VQGLNCEGFKRNWAKPKENGINLKESPKVEGYLCEYQKTQGLFCKNTRAGGGLTGLTQLTRSKSNGSRSSGCGVLRLRRRRDALGLDPTARVVRRRRGGVFRSGPSDHDPAAGDACELSDEAG